jgi:hypothetical protein
MPPTPYTLFLLREGGMCLECRAGQRFSPAGTPEKPSVLTLGLQSEGKPSPEGTKELWRDHVLLSSLTGLDGGGVCTQR